MKFAREIIELMAPYPGRDFKMREIIRYVAPQALGRERAAVKKSVQRAIAALVDCGSVKRWPPHAVNGASTLYQWREVVANQPAPPVPQKAGHELSEIS